MKFTGERFIVGQAVGDIVVEHVQRYQAAARLVQGKTVLDAACGEGYGSFILAESAAWVTGIDISEQAVAYAAQKYQRGNLQYQRASIAALPVADHSVDVVVSFETIEHVNAELQRAFLQEIKRVLKPDGLLFMSSPDKHVYSELRNFNNVYHVHEMYTDEFKKLLGGYFSHAAFFRQGIEDKRLGVIEPLAEETPCDLRLMGSLQMNPAAMQYILAVCSDQPLGASALQSMVSVMPFVQESPVRVFVDCGQGFNEEDVVVGEVAQEGTLYRVRFDFSECGVVQNLRFDPLEKRGCICKITEVRSNLDGLTLVAKNASDRLPDGADRFLHDDPQYAVQGDFSGLSFLELVYQLETISAEDLWKLLQAERQSEQAQWQCERAAQQEEVARQAAALAEATAEKANLVGQLQEIQQSRGYRLLQKYYRLRDTLLPRHSVARLVVKNTLKGILHYKNTLSLINRKNAGKALRDLKHGNFRQLLVRIDNKLSSGTVLRNGSFAYLNELLLEPLNEAVAEDVRIDIVVPIYNAFAFTEKCVASVYENTDVDYELFLIDDCSTDERITAFLTDLAAQDKPANLKKLHIIRNEENLGFIQSVNKAMALGTHHVVLLNTDTEVPPGWLSRLARPVLENPKIASVTPFSNCATICSFPKFCEDNELPEGMNVVEVDAVFAAYGGSRLLELPTGVGFCMLLNRTCLTELGDFDVVYGKGYGEENDWCMRVRQAGYKNVMVANLFVYHKHGVSFAEHTDKGKAARMQENLELLSGRYPDYNKLVADFIALDVGRSEREFLQRLVAVRQEEAREGILFINHCCGGGTKVYQDRLIQSWRTEKRLYGIELQSDAKTLAFTDYSQAEEKVFYFDLTQLSEAQFRRCLEAFQINLIYINQLVTYPLKTMMQYISASRIDYVFFVHDFYAVCPTYTLLNEAGVYCREQQEPDLCNRCLRQVGCELTEDIREWRALFQEFLLGAKAVLAPSQSTADSIRKYYPDLTVCVQEHEVGSYVYPTFDAQTLEDEYLTIAVLGAISEIKGAAIIYELVEKIRAAKLPVRIKVIGITHLHNAYYQSEDGVLEITGVYDNRDVSSLLAQYRVSAVLIASVCPETYSYTTSEAIASGYPVLAFDLGAPAERIRRQDCGWVVEEISSDALLAFLADLAANRGRLKEKAKQL